MSDITEQLRSHFADCPERSGEKSFTRPLLVEATDEIEHLRAEIDRLTLNGIHTCSDRCMRSACVARRERDEARAALADAVSLLTKATGDIAAMCMLAQAETKISYMTAEYVAFINTHDTKHRDASHDA